MKNAGICLTALLMVALAGCSRSDPPQQTAAKLLTAAPAFSARQAAVAGQFYPADADTLAAQVEGYIQAAGPMQLDGDLVAVIAPHAGYQFSGPVAGYSYAPLSGRSYDTVILVGPSHRGLPLTGAALSSHQLWQTPLGDVPVNQQFNRRLLEADSRFIVSDQAHDMEHSLETQLPFLQTVLDDFSIVPIVFSDFEPENTAPLARAIASVADEKTLLVASTDLSHYPVADKAAQVDRAMLEAIATLDVQRVRDTDRDLMARDIPNLHTTVCGLGPVVAVMEAAKMLGASEARVLHYAHSADADPRTADRCVGYGAVAFVGTRREAALEAGVGPDAAGQLDPGQQQYLLDLARSSVSLYLQSRTLPPVVTADPAMHQRRAVFVTLTDQGRLRGCIGQVTARFPLAQAVQEAAVAAATEDRRFPQVTRAELDDLRIEISVLSPLKPVRSHAQVQVGIHGVVVQRGQASGLFLPHVATQQGWNREQMLRALCADKAGLPAEAYRQPGTQLYVFTAQVFGEAESAGDTGPSG